MTAGKSLKDIYDAGTQRLLNLETDSSKNLTTTADNHAQSRKSNDLTALQRVESKTGELENELRKYMALSIERLQKVMESEIKETEEHLGSVKTDLTTLSERLKNSIFELRRAYEENVETLCMSLADGYEGVVESSTMELEKQDFSSSKHMRAHGTVVMNSLQQKLDHSLWESRGEEKQYNSSLFKAFMQKANSIDGHFSTLMQKLSTDFQGHFKVVESQAAQADPELTKIAADLAGEIDGFANQIDSDVRTLFETVVEEHSKKLDNSLSAVAQDLSSVHDATTERLTDQTKQLSDSFVTASGEARKVLITKCTDLREQIETLTERFTTRLEDKLQTSQTLRITLETEKSTIFSDVRRELEEIRDGFESRLSALMTDAVGRVTNIALEAENDITEVHQKCDSDLKRDGLAVKSEIDQSMAVFLQILAENRKNALELIARSAGGAGEGSQKQSLEAIKPGDDKNASPFDFTDDLDF